MEPIFTGWIFFSIVSIVLGIMVGMILLTYRGENTNNNRILSVAVLCLSAALCIATLIDSRIILKIPFLYRTGNIFALIYTPFIYLYVRNAIHYRKFKALDLLHLIPALIYIVDFLPFILLPNSEKLDIISFDLADISRVNSFNQGWLLPDNFHTPARSILIMVYWIAAFLELIGFIRKNKLSSDKEIVPWRNWILIFICLQSFNFIPYFISSGMNLNITSFNIIHLSASAALILTVVFLLYRPLILYGLYVKDLSQFIKGKNESILSFSNESRLADKSQTNIHNESENDESNGLRLAPGKLQFKEVLTNFMMEKTPFLKGGYSLPDLANDLNIHPHQLSLFINQELGVSFVEYLNQQRIAHSVERIKNGDSKNLTLEALARECGFNNRNSFTSAFKKTIGITPSEFIRNSK